jgi:hypothetical protein
MMGGVGMVAWKSLYSSDLIEGMMLNGRESSRMGADNTK